MMFLWMPSEYALRKGMQPKMILRRRCALIKMLRMRCGVTRGVYFRSSGDYIPTPVYKRDQLKSGNVITGPALIEEHASTTVVQPDDIVQVDQLGNLQISIGGERT